MSDVVTTDPRIIVPAQSGPTLKAVNAGMTDALPVPLAEIIDPARTPLAYLPWLAAHVGVQLWYSDWSQERRRQMVADWPRLAELVGTRAAASAFLDYVDTRIIHKVSHPARFPVGRIAAGITPIQHKPFMTRYLLKVDLVSPVRAMIVGRSAVGRTALRVVDREPIRRASSALSLSKSPATATSVTFAHRLPVTLDDSIDLDQGHVLGGYNDRISLS